MKSIYIIFLSIKEIGALDHGVLWVIFCFRKIKIQTFAADVIKEREREPFSRGQFLHSSEWRFGS